MRKLKDLLGKKPSMEPVRAQVEKTVDTLNERFHLQELNALSDALKENKSLLGAFIQSQYRMIGCWVLLWAGVMALLLFLNLFIHPHHPHFVVDAYFGFWAVFSLVVGVVMIFVMKRIVQPLIVRKEDYYGDI